MDETHNPFVGDEKLFDKRAAEMQKRLTRRDGSVMTLAQSKRASEVQKDINMWEENRLFTSGVVRAREVRASCLIHCSCHVSMFRSRIPPTSSQI